MLKLKKTKKDKTAPAKDKKQTSTNNPQGIVAGNNGLHKIAVTALAIIVAVLLVSFGYLLSIREPAVQGQQVDRVATAYASQQATNVHRVIGQLRLRLQSAAKSPLVFAAASGQNPVELKRFEQSMLDFFPEVLSFKVVPIDEMGTASFTGGDQGMRNHIEVDLVRRTSVGQKTEPQAFRFEDRWLTSIAELVSSAADPQQRAVVIATIDNNQLNEQMGALDTAAGRFTLEQIYTSSNGVDRTDIIAFAGTSSGDADYTRYATIPSTSWRVAYAPSAELMGTLETPATAVFLVMVLTILAAIGALFLLLVRNAKLIEENVQLVIAGADRRSEMQLSIPELVPVARQLRRATLRALRQTEHAPEPASQSSSGEALDLDLVLSADSGSGLPEASVLELDLGSAGNLPMETGFPAHIFRAYDIRGDSQTELTEELIARIGGAIGSIAGEMGEQALLVACDGRNSSPALKSALVKSLMASGRDVIDIGMVPTPLLYFATQHLTCRSGIMVTGSHNPVNDNGLKIVLNQQTIAAGGIAEIRDRVLTGEYTTGSGRMIREDILPAYTDAIVEDIAIAVPLKIVLDAGNGATSDIAPELFEELGCEVVPLYCSVDGSFPNRSPDTSDESNLTALIEAVEREEADFGVAFDGDGDRLAVVTSSGRIVRSDVLLMIFAQDVVSRNPGADVVFDVKCSRNLTKLITNNGGRPVLWKTGHAFMKEKMLETGALLGGEFSGHMFFGERWFGFDDGMYAAGRLAEILSTHGDSLDAIIDTFPTSVNTPEIIIPVTDQEKHPLMDEILRTTDFSSGKINTMDGIRVDFTDGWGLIRASNTSAALTARFEADTEEALEIIKGEFREQIALVRPSLELNF